MNEHIQAGFTYLFEWIKDGVVVDSETVHNLLPTEGANYMLNAAFHGGTQVTSWYVGLYEGNYTPTVADTAAGFPGAATECTAYVETARPAFTSGAAAAGVIDNSANRAEFTSNANKVVYGGFISSVATKGATTGVLSSAVRFASPRNFDSGSVLRVTAGFTLTST